MFLKTAALGSLCLLPLSVYAQAGQPAGRICGLTDMDIPTPVHSTKTESDASAIQAFIGFVSMSGVSGWKGATAAGTVAAAGDSATHQATVSLAGNTQSRMDVTRDAGTESTIFNGDRGTFISTFGKQSTISPDIAVLGLFAFVRLVSSGYPLATSVLTDQGSILIAGKTLHRITLDDASTNGLGNPWKTIDLYFDPATHQLVESVAFVHLSSSDAALYTLEASYGGYAQENGTTLPHTITQSLNGQLQWTLLLSTINLSSIPAASLFTF